MNRIYGEEGESLKISNETVGHVLKNLGLYTRRLGNTGRGLVPDKVTRPRAHELGHANQILPENVEAVICGYWRKNRSILASIPTIRQATSRTSIWNFFV